MPAPLLLRPMTLDDLDIVAELDRRAFGASGWSRRYFAGELTDSPISVFYVLVDRSERSERMLGYFGTWHVLEQLHLCTFAVDPDRQGQGLGGLLLNCVLRLAQRLACEVVQLEVRESNTAARSLYQTRGFVEEDVRRNLYANPREDGVLMSLATPSRIEQASAARAFERWPSGILLRWDDRGGAHEERWPNERPAIDFAP